MQKAPDINPQGDCEASELLNLNVNTMARGFPDNNPGGSAALLATSKVNDNRVFDNDNDREQCASVAVPTLARTSRKCALVPTVAQLQNDPKSVSMEHKLLVLSNPPVHHNIWEGAKASFETTGSLRFISDEFTDFSIPSNKPAQGSTVTVRVYIHGLKLNPSICAEITISHSRQRVHRCKVEWPFQHVKHRGGSLKSGVTDLAAGMGRDHEYLEMSFVPECAVSSNLLPVLHDISLLHLDDDTSLTTNDVHLLTMLAKMVENPMNRRMHVRFDIDSHERRLLAAGDTQTPFGQLLQKLPTSQNIHNNADVCSSFTGPRWRTYRQGLDQILSGSGRRSPEGNEGSSTISQLTASSLQFSGNSSQLSVRSSQFSGNSSRFSSNSSRFSTNSSRFSSNIPRFPGNSLQTPRASGRSKPPAFGALQSMSDSMLTRHVVLSSPHPGTPIPSRIVFADQDDAIQSLTYGAKLEYEEEAITFDAVRRDLHYVRLCSVDTRVLALIDFSSAPMTGLPDDRFRLDDRTKVKLSIRRPDTLSIRRPDTDETDDDHIVTQGLIVANVFKLPRCDLLILITDRYSASFREMVFPIEDVQLDDGCVPKYLGCVSPEQYPHPMECEVKAVVHAYGNSGAHSRLPFLLNDGSQLPNMCPVKDVLETTLLPAFNKLLNAKAWNKEQRQAIESLRRAPGGSMIVTGPGGTGKTELIVHLIKFATACGQHAIVSGVRNDTLDDMTLKIDKLDPSLRPVRFYTPKQEDLSTFYLGNEKRAPSASANRLLVSTFDAIEADTKNSRRALPKFSVKGRVCQNFGRGPLNRVVRPQGLSSQSGVLIDVRAYFQRKVPLLETNLYFEDAPWFEGDEEKDRILQAYRHLRTEVLNEAKVVLCTNVMSANKNISYDFAREKEVWVFQDEAQSMTESAALIPLSLHDPLGRSGRKVVMHFLSGDLKQLPPFTMARTGRFNTVNEFAAQRNVSLMERKLKSCFPATDLVEQRRAAEILMRGANMFHYGGKLVTPVGYPPLSADVSGLIPKLAGFNMSPRDTEEKQRIAWLETPNPVYQNKFTGSRANPGNAALVRKCLFKVHDTYGKRTNAKVMLATPYKRQKELYLSIAVELKASHGWSDSELPRIVTIDSLIGRESSLVILDLVNDHTEGFLRDVRRACVAFTRAKDMFLVVGGKFPLPPVETLVQPKVFTDPVNGSRIRADKSRPLAFYYAWFKANGFVYPADMSGIDDISMPTDLCPLGEDLEDEQIGQEFAKNEELLPVKDGESWEIVETDDDFKELAEGLADVAM